MTKVLLFQLLSRPRAVFESLLAGEPDPQLRSAIIRRCGSKWCLYSHKGKVLGRHDTYGEAAAQEKAIEISKAQRHGADWDESKHPRVPAGESNGGEFAGVEFPHADDSMLGLLDTAAAREVRDSHRLFKKVHGEESAHDEYKASGFKHGVSAEIGPKLDAQFDAAQLEMLAKALNASKGGDVSAGQRLSASYVDMWAATSGDHNAMAVLYQHAAMEELGFDANTDHLMGGESFQQVKSRVASELFTDNRFYDSKVLPPDKATDFVYATMKAHARAQYESTQAALKGAPDTLTLVRGMSLDPEHAATIARSGVAALQPLSSFTSDLDTASNFAGGGIADDWEEGLPSPTRSLTHGHIVRARIPKSRIFSMPRTGFGCLSEYEFVVLGTKKQPVKIGKRFGKFNTGPLKPKPVHVHEDQGDPEFVPFLGRDAKYNPNQPREPRGESDGGQWTAISGRAVRGDMRPGTAADRKRLGIPPAYTDLQVTDDKNAELIATARTPKGKLASFYSESYHDKQAAAKWERIQALQKDLPGMLERVNYDIAHKTANRDVAMTIRLIAQTGLRNGGDAGEGIGASNLQLKHVTLVGGNKVRLQFKGKGGVDQDHTVNDRVFAAYVRERVSSSADGRLFPHDAADTLAYQKLIGNGRYKVHDLRTHVGTTLASKLTQEVIAKGLAPTNAKDHKSVLKQIAVQVSRRLGNTPAIALSTYIHPSAVAPLKGWKKAA